MNELIILALGLLTLALVITFVAIIALGQRLDSLEKYSENLEHRHNIVLVNMREKISEYWDDFNEEKQRQQKIHEACSEALTEFYESLELQAEGLDLLYDHLGLDIEETEPGFKLVKRVVSNELH